MSTIYSEGHLQRPTLRHLGLRPARIEMRSELAARLAGLRLPARRSTTVMIDLTWVDSLSQEDAVALKRAECRFRANGRHLTLMTTSPAVRRQVISLGLGSLLSQPADR